MSRKYKINESKADIDQLMLTYFNFINGKYMEKALKNFAEKEGYGQEIVFVFFQSDLDEYDMAQLPRPLDEKHVLIELGYPAVEVEQMAYLDFKTFYNYLNENVKKEIAKNPEKTELTDLLEEVKHRLYV
ncbi:hypothetical protein [Bacillus ndiopicus]|uniref:hypothetical protein n=1 Tax=Bacillus ndiopicus TaxID=1347368 RepID=UPI0005A8E152|nr:hypothetical protein [Bacillus ndiopicus]